jgi:hypothetical protein
LCGGRHRGHGSPSQQWLGIIFNFVPGCGLDGKLMICPVCPAFAVEPFRIGIALG